MTLTNLETTAHKTRRERTEQQWKDRLTAARPFLDAIRLARYVAKDAYEVFAAARDAYEGTPGSTPALYAATCEAFDRWSEALAVVKDRVADCAGKDIPANWVDQAYQGSLPRRELVDPTYRQEGKEA